MKQTLKDMASISEMAKYLSDGDINRLLPAIIYNNPQDVNENLKSQGLVNYLMEPDELLQWFEDNGNEMDFNSFFDTLDVPFEPNAQNITSQLEPVVMYKMQLDQGANDSGDNLYGTWGDAFGDGIKRMYEKYFSTNLTVAQEETAQAPTGTGTKPVTSKKPNNDKLMQILFIVGLVVIAVSMILITIRFIKK